ncbi:hypothetical protein [Halorussus caseinilyticus]|uniref:Uncharacterized protein n=1 Tax=Halorussus caseinilyticus TaxID=3034025 RepID=A0ABD5WKU6_9EURY|nr:hypothetical protein [Halorussus sp. DT72]
MGRDSVRGAADERARRQSGRRRGEFRASGPDESGPDAAGGGSGASATETSNSGARADETVDSVFDDYGFANAMLVHLNVADARVADVPMPAEYGDEESGIRYSTFVPQLSALLAKGFGWRLAEKHVRRESHPLVAFYGLGVVGTLAGTYATVRDALDGSEPSDRVRRCY